jgi:hypothetical protein
MEIIGDDKRLRALFSEARLIDEQTMPSFASVWRRAHSRSAVPRRAFDFGFVTATALLLFGLGSLAVWSQYYGTNERINSVSATLAAHFNVNPSNADAASIQSPSKIPVKKSPARVVKVNTHRQSLLAANRKAAEEAKVIASWQSPTASLLSSSTEELFNALPQLNENATQMKSFLPNGKNDKEK